MCEPMTLALAAGGTTAAGLVAQEYGIRKQAKARYKAVKAEVGRQDAYGDISKGIFDKQLDKFSAAKQLEAVKKQREEQNAASKELQGDFAGEDLEAAGLPSLNTGTDSAIKNQIMRGLSEATERSEQKSAFDAFGRAGNEFNQDARVSGLRLGHVADDAQASANVLPYALNVANYKGRYARMIGQLLMSAGGAGASAAAFSSAPAGATGGNMTTTSAGGGTS